VIETPTLSKRDQLQKEILDLIKAEQDTVKRLKHLENQEREKPESGKKKARIKKIKTRC